jgi:GAF domain-containing protein
VATVLRSGDRFRLVAEIARDLHGIRDCTPLLRETTSVLQEHFDLTHIYIYLFDESTRNLVLQAGSIQAEETPCKPGHRVPFEHGQSPIARAAREQKVALIGDDDAEPASASGTCCKIVVPLMAGDQLVGVLDLRTSRTGCFDQAALDVLGLLADHIAVATQNACLLMEIQEAVARLREVDRHTNSFLADVSYQLRTLLNSILGYAEIMLMGLDGRLPSEAREDVQAIYENGQSLLHSIGIIEEAAGVVENVA